MPSTVLNARDQVVNKANTAPAHKKTVVQWEHRESGQGLAITGIGNLGSSG